MFYNWDLHYFLALVKVHSVTERIQILFAKTLYEFPAMNNSKNPNAIFINFFWKENFKKAHEASTRPMQLQ